VLQIETNKYQTNKLSNQVIKTAMPFILIQFAYFKNLTKNIKWSTVTDQQKATPKKD
jgi:hypothetical protein